MSKEDELNSYELNDSLKILAKTSMFVFIGVFLSKIFIYLYKVVVARYFGPESYGIFSLAIMVLGLFTALASLGLSEGILRFIAIYRAKNEIRKIRFILRFSVAISVISGIIFGIILFFTANLISINIFNNVKLIIYLKSFGILIPFILIFNILLQILRAFEKIKSFSFLQNIFQNALKLIFLLLFIFLGLNTENSIILSLMLTSFILLIMTYILSMRAAKGLFADSMLEESQKSKITKSLISYSWPITFSGFIGTIFYLTDSFILGYFKGAETVGFYNAAIPIAALFLMSTEIFMQLFYPMITREYSAGNFKLIKELSKQLSKWTFIINFPALLLVLLFPGVIINFLFGGNYLIAENSLRILAAIMCFNSIVSISSSLIIMMGKSKIVLLNTIVFSILNFTLNVILVPNYGMEGAAIASFISMLLSGLLFMFWAYHYLSIIPLKRKMLKIAVISLILFVPLVILKYVIVVSIFNLLVISVVFLILYLALIYLTGCFDKNDMLILNSIRKKIINKKIA